MANPFLTGKADHSEIETAIIYDKARIVDIGKAVAYTDGDRLYVNTEDNLYKILPDYNEGMLKWLLWHEKYHMELKHHSRFFKFLEELKKHGLDDKDIDELKKASTVKKHIDRVASHFNLTQEEVNIIMDILVHDSLSKMFPELVETALINLAQMRNRNSLSYTFTTHTLEEMLDEYSKHKRGEDKESGDKGKGEGEGESEKDETAEGEEKGDKKKGPSGKGTKKAPPSPEKGKDTSEKGADIEEAERPTPTPESEHDKTDWSKLDKIDTKEFITEEDADYLDEKINKLKRKKIKMGRLTQKLNGLASTKRDRTYRLPSMLSMGDGCIFKGKTPGRVELYLVFDASGSMSSEMKLFKEIITRSIPQALTCPCEWFAGYDYEHKSIKPYKTEGGDGYYKGTFKDFLPISASSGYYDDGDRTIELCYQAEQKGYSPIGITDGGGRISWSKDKLMKLRRTVLVGQNGYWLAKAKEINPNIQTLDIEI